MSHSLEQSTGIISGSGTFRVNRMPTSTYQRGSKLAKVVIFLHGKQKAGKSTLADAFQTKNFDWKRMAFAGPLKDGCRAMGVDVDDFSPTKDRKTLQDIGVYFRENKGADWWVDLLVKRVDEFFTKEGQHFYEGLVNAQSGIIVDDLRFRNEFAVRDRLRELDYEAYNIKIEVSPELQQARGATMERAGHISETDLDLFPDSKWDMIIPENTEVETRVRMLEELCKTGLQSSTLKPMDSTPTPTTSSS